MNDIQLYYIYIHIEELVIEFSGESFIVLVLTDCEYNYTITMQVWLDKPFILFILLCQISAAFSFR